MRTENDRNFSSLNLRLGTVFACACALLLICSGCAATHEPERWSRSVGEMPENVNGSWIWLTLQKKDLDKKAESFGGVLIAGSSDSLYVASPTLRVLPRASITEAKLARYDAYEGGVMAVTLIGSLTTISNGWFAELTFPMWICGGAFAAIERSYTPVLDYPEVPFETISKFARFPAGMPDGVDRSTMIMPRFKRSKHAI
jgi:hypothetical protein